MKSDAATLRLFGTPALCGPAGAERLFTPERPFQMLAYLACRADWLRRDELAEWLWPERAPSVARSNLRKVLLLAQRIPGLPPLQRQGDRLRWAPPSDLQQFEAACTEGRHAEALALGGGVLLNGLDDGLAPPALDWLAFERERVAARWRAAATARLAELAGQPGDAAVLAEAMLQRDPFDEAALAALVQARHALGDPVAARQALARHTRRLAEDLGLQPSAAVRALVSSTPSVAAEPVLVGRRLELARIETLLREGRRLVTLVGPGGVGKSRCARAALRALAPSLADGACWLALQDLADAGQVPAALAGGLGLDLRAGEAWSTIERQLATRELLLVFDSAEHLADGLAAPLAALLAACPRLRLLVTSRSSLGLAGECLLSLDGLPLPDTDETDVGLLRLNDAVCLFEHQALLADPGFSLVAQASGVVRLVHAVEGLPLAIELAAAWVRLLPVQAIVEELIRSPEVLAAPRGKAGVRDRSLRASFDHSWRLLSRPERSALLALALLPAAFDRDMARQVAAVTLPMLAQLADRSLVRADEQGHFSLHPLLRACALEKQNEAAVDAAAQRARHAAWLGHLLQRFEERRSLQGAAARAQLTPLLPHLRAAWQWSIETRDAPLARRFAIVGAEFHRLRGLWGDAVACLQQAVAAFDTGDPQHARARLQSMLELGVLQYHGSSASAAEATLRAVLRLAGTLREPGVVPRALLSLGNGLIDLGRSAQAAPLFARALRLAERDGDAVMAAVARLCQGTLALVDGQLVQAEGHLAAAIPVLAASDHHDALAGALLNLGNLQFGRDDFAVSLQSFEQARSLCERHELASTLPYAWVNIGLSQAALGRHDAARSAFERALAQSRVHGEPLVEAHALRGLAAEAMAEGQAAPAWRELRAAFAVAQAADLRALQLHCLLHAAEWRGQAGDLALAGWAMRWLAARPETEPEHRQKAEAWLAAHDVAEGDTPGWSLADAAARLIR